MLDYLISAPNLTDRFIVRIDPRAKLILLILIICGILFSREISKVIAFSILIIGLTGFSGLPAFAIFNIVLKIYPIIFVVSLFQIINQWGPSSSGLVNGLFNIPHENWFSIVLFQLKSVDVLLAGIVFILSTPYLQLLKGMEKLHWPDRIITVMFFIYRFLFILSSEMHRMHIAFKSRYIKLPLRRRLTVYTKLISMYFMRIFERNENMFNALVSKGFEGKAYCGRDLVWHDRDTLVLGAGLTVIAIIIFIA